MSEADLPFFTRLWFAWACFFRVLLDGSFASRAWDAREPKALPPSPVTPPPEPAKPAAMVPPPADAALQLLAIFQREGRLIDFLEQDVASFEDADIGAAARAVHEGCRKALRSHAKLEPVRPEDEGARVTLESGFNPEQIKLSGDVRGAGPWTGVLRHRGWKAKEMTLPVPVVGHDARVIAAAEVEL